MSMIFPGMDPYLENPSLWKGVHDSLIVYIRDVLNPLIRPRYVAAIEGRVYLEREDRFPIPDVRISRTESRSPSRSSTATLEADAPVRVVIPPEEVEQTYINVLDMNRGRKVVTVLEVLSPKNKAAGPGRTSYLEKQAEVVASDAHLVEIDLLRRGRHALFVPLGTALQAGPYDYLVSVCRGEGKRREAEIYPRSLRDRLPKIAVPLSGDDRDATLDIQAVVEQAHEKGAYRDLIDYAKPCRPRLSASDQAWATERVRAATDAR